MSPPTGIADAGITPSSVSNAEAADNSVYIPLHSAERTSVFILGPPDNASPVITTPLTSKPDNPVIPGVPVKSALNVITGG